MSIAVANRYARALADVVGAGGDFRRVLGELETFAGTYRESAELREAFSSPAVPLLTKTNVLMKLAAALEVSLVTRNFLRVLLAHYRMGLIEQVCQAFRKITNELLGIAEVSVTAASPLSGEEEAALLRRFQELTGKAVELRFRVDSDLLGGVVAQVASTVYDGSIRGELDRMREKLRAQ
jgi:F-type H+-transporting ATPase subunit delta